MAIKKNGSRFTDRNTIRRMKAEGYNIQQIADKTSITLEHVQYVLTKWSEDEERIKDQSKARAEREAKALTDQNRAPGAETTVEMRARLKAEILAELRQDTPAPEPTVLVAESAGVVGVDDTVPNPGDDLDGMVPMDLGEDIPKPEAKPATKRKRRTRTAA